MKAQLDLSAVKDLDQAKIGTDKVQPEVDDCDGPKCDPDDKKRDDLGRLQFSMGKISVEISFFGLRVSVKLRLRFSK